MAWTTPRTWVTSELVTAAEMNAHVRDNLNYLNSGGVLTTMGDDTAINFTPSNTFGIMAVALLVTGHSLCRYRVTTGLMECVSIVDSGNITYGTAALAGTTGTDAKFNISCYNGKIYLENRLGSTMYPVYNFIVAAS